MFPLIVSIAMLLQTGLATYYDPGVMEEVYTGRLHDGQVEPCPACIGMVSLINDEDVGSIVYLERISENPHILEGPFLAVDCAEEPSYHKGHVVEVDWPTSRRWHMAGPILVRVYKVVPSQRDLSRIQ